MPTDTNRRRYDRTEVNIVVQVSVPEGPPEARSEATIRVLGGGGAYLEIAEDCPVGTLVLLRMMLPGDAEPLVCHGLVCHAVDGQGAGLEFLGIRPSDRARLVAFVEGQRAED